MSTFATVVGYFVIAVVVIVGLAVAVGKFIGRKKPADTATDKWGTVENPFGRHTGRSRYAKPYVPPQPGPHTSWNDAKHRDEDRSTDA